MASIVTTDPPVVRNRSLTRRLQRFLSTSQAYLYLLPMLVILAVFYYAPAFYVFYISAFKWNFLSHGAQPLAGADGLDNYRFLLTNPYSHFWDATRTTIAYVGISMPLNVILSLLLAILLMSGIKGRAFWRLAIFMPFITPLVATVAIWEWIFDRYHGFLNGILHIFGHAPILWLDDPRYILPSIITYTTWKAVGFNIVIFMAGLANVDPSLGEAARVDGANAWQVFRHITWPTLAPITTVVVLLSTIEAFKMFQPALLFAGPNGGAGNAAQTLGLLLYNEAFTSNPHDGVGAAISVFIFLLVFTISAIQLGFAGRRAR